MEKGVTQVIEIPEVCIKKIQLEHAWFARLIEYGGEYYVDIRKFWRDNPTKNGIKIKLSKFNKLYELINKE